jgi:hypothetical protein
VNTETHMMRKYINRNYPDFTAEQRADGNYNLKKKGSYGYTIRIAKDIEQSEDWERVINTDGLVKNWWGDDDVWDFYKSVLDNVEAVEDPRKSYKTKDSANNAHTPLKKRKPQGILSVRVKDKKYKLEQEYKNSKIVSFFTDGSDIWVSLFCGEQYKL